MHVTVDLKIGIDFKTNALEHNPTANVLVNNLGVIHDLADGPVPRRLRVAAVAPHTLLTIARLVVLGRELCVAAREQRALRDGCVWVHGNRHACC